MSIIEDIRAEILEESPDLEMLVGYIDERIKTEVSEALSNIDYATKTDVEDAIIKFNDR